MATQTNDAAKAVKINPADGFSPEEVKNLSSVLNALLADVFALYLKTKNFHWHMSGPHFRDYHLLLDEQATQIFAISDDIAERVRKIGGTTVRSIGHIARLQRIQDNDHEENEFTPAVNGASPFPVPHPPTDDPRLLALLESSPDPARAIVRRAFRWKF